MTETNLPLEELKAYGLVDKENNFNSKLSKADIEGFKNGSTIHAEDSDHRLSFSLKDSGSRLEVNVYFKDIVNHKELSTAELLELSFSKSNQYKVMADFGTITKIEKGYHSGNQENEMTTFVELENERGKTRFYGNDLEEKLKDFSVGDKIQIENTGINKATISVETENGIKDYTKYDNVFKVDDFEEKNKKFQSKLFEYDSKSKNVTSIDTTDLEIKSINGISLSKKQTELLKKGKEVDLDDELSVQLSPNAMNEANLKATARTLLVVSLAIDGGISALVVRGIVKLARMVEENQKQIEHSKLAAELQKMELIKKAKTSELYSTKAVANNSEKRQADSGKDISEKVQPTFSESQKEVKLQKNETFSGVLIAKGSADYLHNKENGKSFFVTVLDKNNEEKTIWGVDLNEKTKDISLFQNIEIKFLGKQDVEIQVPVKNQINDNVIMETKTVHRNSFEVIENDDRIISHKEAQSMKSNSEKLDQMKGFLQSKSRLYPENKNIISSINIIDKFVSAQPVTPKESTKNLQVVDYDTFEDANRKKQNERALDNDEEKTKSKGRSR